MFDPVDIAVQFEKHLNSPKQTWLLGAGISFGANIPLMTPLTERVLHVARMNRMNEDEEAKRVIDFIETDVDEGANIEEFLTHLGDFISMASRARSGSIMIDNQSVPKDTLIRIHSTLLEIISDTVRWGYSAPVVGDNGKIIKDELIGEPENTIVVIDEHLAFINAVFHATRAGLEDIRSPVEFFTTNYDTLLEDALALSQISYQDGFAGGGVAFWKKGAFETQSSTQAIVTKLHGSIDWYHPPEDTSRLFRVRNADKYPDDGGTVMIYPQATKYLNAQRDPFAELFQRFRVRLESGTDQVLLVCGYSFGDEHINTEIENALSNPKSQLTVVAFTGLREKELPEVLEIWRKNQEWGEQVFVASPRGLHQGSSQPVFGKCGDDRDWWTFAGVTRLLSQGFPADVVEQLQ